ncbi:hypothetical protein [Rhodoplanes roseus]|uniref:Uncharacterized protein n=1 Tax=Rhodoplanes roseus TaxID=29409 RepID=A0A327K8H2_9BRAD|nr:hypothetical protein [Rhodoplanes roseus]RAI35019.1 hypothetical protein CH341_31115 [Rhodoplanes roseus]
MTPATKTLLIALSAAMAAAVATPADAGRARVTVRPVAVHPAWPGAWAGTWYGAWSDGGGPAVYGRALRTTVYPYGPRGDGVRGYWYPTVVRGACAYGYVWC